MRGLQEVFDKHDMQVDILAVSLFFLMINRKWMMISSKDQKILISCTLDWITSWALPWTRLCPPLRAVEIL